jgi:hypothetical protein
MASDRQKGGINSLWKRWVFSYLAITGPFIVTYCSSGAISPRLATFTPMQNINNLLREIVSEMTKFVISDEIHDGA